MGDNYCRFLYLKLRKCPFNRSHNSPGAPSYCEEGVFSSEQKGGRQLLSILMYEAGGNVYLTVDTTRREC
jgi:hypothetical protein